MDKYLMAFKSLPTSRKMMLGGILLACFWVFLFFRGCTPQVASEDLSRYTMLVKDVDGTSMEPLIKNGSKILLATDYYKDKKVAKRWDIVAYDYPWNTHPLIKIIKATSEDTVAIDQNEQDLIINGTLLQNSAGRKYRFSQQELRMLGLYVKDGHIPPESYLIFGDNVMNSIDSRKFGAVSLENFKGRFFIQ